MKWPALDGNLRRIAEVASIDIKTSNEIHPLMVLGGFKI